jgi:hypothetical protein
VLTITIHHRLSVLGFTDREEFGGADFAESVSAGMPDIVRAVDNLFDKSRQQLPWPLDVIRTTRIEM